MLLFGWSDRKTHEFFLDREYPEVSVLARVWDALREDPQPREVLRARAVLDKDLFDNAIEKLWIHGGARLDASSNAAARGGPGWEASYLAQQRHKREQLERITRYAGSRGCRMGHLVAHFGDQEDDGRRCGRCDMCAPRECSVLRFRAPTGGERAAMGRLLASLRQRDGQASGRLHRELVDTGLDRERVERLVDALARAGSVVDRPDSFDV